MLPGWTSNNVIELNDTLISFGLVRLKNPYDIIINYSSISNGKLYYSDTIEYCKYSKDTIYSVSFIYDGNQTILGSNTKQITIGVNYSDKTNTKFKVNAGLFSLNPFRKLQFEINQDTFETYLMQTEKTNNTIFCIKRWVVPVNNGGKDNYQLLKLHKDSIVNIIYEKLNPKSCPTCPITRLIEFKGDKKSNKFLFVNERVETEFTGSPHAWNDRIVKLDTQGNASWNCIPNNNDSVNSHNFKFVQLPNGNLICTWNNFTHPPHKDPYKNNNYETVNENASVWFAEVDYISGKVLWRKNIKSYLGLKIQKGIKIDSAQHIFIEDCKITNDNSIAWVGVRETYFPIPFRTKNQSVILKTDLQANPIWYREHDFFPGDTGDEGQKTVRFIQVKDSSFILTGEYKNYFGQASNGEFWQKGSIVRLNKFGCFESGCEKKDNIEIIKKISPIIYPNPSNNEITISTYLNIGDTWELKIYNVIGELIQSNNFENEFTLSLTPNLPGIYFFQLQNLNSGEMFTQKIILN